MIHNSDDIDLSEFKFEQDMSVQECIHNAMSAGMIVHSLYYTQKINHEQYICFLDEIRDVATSMIIRNTVKNSLN